MALHVVLFVCVAAMSLIRSILYSEFSFCMFGEDFEVWVFATPRAHVCWHRLPGDVLIRELVKSCYCYWPPGSSQNYPCIQGGVFSGRHVFFDFTMLMDYHPTVCNLQLVSCYFIAIIQCVFHHHCNVYQS